MTLPEDAPVEDIVAWFTERGFEVVVHTDPPPRPVRRTVPRSARNPPAFSHWCSIGGAKVARWYGGGNSEQEAIRAARARWRIEQEGHPPTPRHLP